MAIILENTRCPICNEKLDRPFTSTSGAIFPREHLLWSFCDAPLHLDCLEAWPHRVEFSQGYFDSHLKRHQMGYGYLLKQEANWLWATGPHVSDSFPSFTAIYLREWPVTLYSEWNGWEQFVAGGFRQHLVGRVLEVSIQIMSEVAQVAPDLNSLIRLYEPKALIADSAGLEQQYREAAKLEYAKIAALQRKQR